MKVLVACEESQAVTKELRRLGHEAYSCDVMPPSGGHPEWHITGDVLPHLEGYGYFQTSDGSWHGIERERERWDLVIAFPPCTYLTNAGAVRLFKAIKEGEWQMMNIERLKNGIKGRDFFMRMMGANSDHIAIENPVPSSIWSLPDPTQTIQPYEFGHPYTKRTCLWLKNLPLLVPTEIVEPKMAWVSAGSKKADGRPRDMDGMTFRDSERRSKTFSGIARAMAEQWTTEEAMNNRTGWRIREAVIEEQYEFAFEGT